jgi:HAD superfamily hydrolase (TIGR01509 family)
MESPQIQQWDALLFDLDGTLIDSERLAADTLVSEIESLGLRWNSEDAAFITGRTWKSAFTLLYSKYAFPVNEAELSHRVLSRYRERLRSEVKEVPGAREAVQSLAKEFPLALVSGSHREEIFIALDALGIRGCFQVILGAEDYREGKPSPEGYLKAVNTLKVRADRCLVFEDSEAGIAAGIAAGFKVAAITSTNHFQMNTKNAHYFIDDLRGVGPDWVRSLSSSTTSG